MEFELIYYLKERKCEGDGPPGKFSVTETTKYRCHGSSNDGCVVDIRHNIGPGNDEYLVSAEDPKGENVPDLPELAAELKRHERIPEDALVNYKE